MPTKPGVQVVKKDKSVEDYDASKITDAVSKAAFRCDKIVPQATLDAIAREVYRRIEHRDRVTVAELHELVIAALSFFQMKEVGEAYAEYRYYKTRTTSCASATVKTPTTTVPSSRRRARSSRAISRRASTSSSISRALKRS